MPFDPFTGPAQLSPLQRGLIGAIPYVGPIYTAGRGVNALVQYLRNLNNNGQLPTNSETNNPPMYANNAPPPQSGSPFALPTNSETNAPPMYGGGAPAGYGGGINFGTLGGSSNLSTGQRNAIGLGTLSSAPSTSVPGVAAANYGEILRRNQL